ncbi:MAG: CheY-like chemotaxis protein [Candidatus Omnitrophota bacterium]|jgi:CheY-like chemotaxis protein
MSETESAHFKILVIDDSGINRELLKSWIESGGYEVEGAESAREAFYLLYEKSFDLIICDYQMPEIDGEEFLHKLRRDDKLQALPVIMFSGDGGDAIRKKLHAAGANDFIEKGAEFDVIINTIKTNLLSIKKGK